MGSPADPPTGRLFIDKSSYLGQGGRGALVMMDMCNGGVLVFSESASAFEVQAPAHRFRVQQLPDGTFAVDGSWIAPGTALKVGYYLHHGDKRDEEYVRVVFEAPGRWPLARMGVSGADLIGLPPRPTQGSGLVVDVPVAPAELREPLALVLDATPGRVQGITAMRAVHDGERLTELTMRVLTSDGAFTWYGAGREGDSLRLLGAFAPAPGVEPRVAAPRVLDIAALPWDTLRAGVEGGPLDVRLDPSARWAMTGNLSLGSGDAIPLGTCDAGCVFVRQGDAWERVILPERSEAAGAATLRVFLQEDASVWWHAP